MQRYERCYSEWKADWHLLILQQVGRIESVSQVQLMGPMCGVHNEARLCGVEVAQPVQHRVGGRVWGDAQDVCVLRLPILPGS